MVRKRFDSASESKSATTLYKSDYTVGDVSDSWIGCWKQGYTIFRLLPGIDPESEVPKVDTYRVQTERSNMFGNWRYTVPCVSMKGTMGNKVSYVVANSVNYTSRDIEGNPCDVLRKAVHKRYVETKNKNDLPSSFMLAHKDLGFGPEETLFVNAQIYINGGDPLKPEKWTERHSVLRFRGTNVINRFNFVLAAREDIARRNGEAWDPVALNPSGPGSFFVMTNPERDIVGLDQSLMHNISPPKTNTKNSMDTFYCGVSDVYPVNRDPWFNHRPHIDPSFESVITSKYKDWSDVIRFTSFDEQAELLATAYPPDVILYGWGETHPHWIPASVKAAADSSYMPTRMPVAVAPQPQQYQPQPQVPQQPVQQPQVPTFNAQGQINVNYDPTQTAGYSSTLQSLSAVLGPAPTPEQPAQPVSTTQAQFEDAKSALLNNMGVWNKGTTNQAADPPALNEEDIPF